MLLSPKYKEIIMLYYWQDMPVQEIGRLLSVSQSTVSRRLEKARNKLFEMLEGRDPR